MLEDFNLLVSSARGNEEEANSELWYLVSELGDHAVKTDFTPVSGLTVAKTKLDPIGTVSKLRAILKEHPWEFRYILKVKPIGRVVPSEASHISKAVAQLATEIRGEETFRVSLEKRQNHISSKEVIDTVASVIPRKVDLRNPDKIVLVEIIGKLAGVSVVEPADILGIEREKRTH